MVQGHINNNNACFSSHQCTILYYSILCYPVKERKKERKLWLLSLCLSVAGRLWFRFLFLTLLSLCALNSVRTNSNYGDGGECELSFALGWWLYTPLSFSSYLYLSSFFFFFFLQLSNSYVFGQTLHVQLCVFVLGYGKRQSRLFTRLGSRSLT